MMGYSDTVFYISPHFSAALDECGLPILIQNAKNFKEES